jgi:hypothetical protein
MIPTLPLQTQLPFGRYSRRGGLFLRAAREVICNAAFHGRGGKVKRPLRLQIGLCAYGNNGDTERDE